VWRFLFIAFLFVHGAIQAAQATGGGDSWLLGRQKGISVGLTLAAGALFVVAAVGLWARAEWWRPVTVTGAALSLLFFVVYFNPFILFGMALDVGLIVAIAWLDWPSKSMVGA
jgi:NADH:ubiquinone oxidoreductase subunit 6 (subunit J)